jgi:hypothetical protein
MAINMNEIITGVVLSKVCSISPDNEAKKAGDKKHINLKVKFDGALVSAIFDKALAGTVITWANGPGRNNYDKWANNQVVEIAFISPASKATESPEDAFTREAIAAGVDVSNDDELTAYVIKRMKATKA